MRIRFDFELPGGKITLPIHYNYLVQAMIYKSISERLAGFLHSHGFVYEKRQFKLFTFSKLFGDYRIKKRGPGNTMIDFFSGIYFYLSSSYEEILQEFANRMVSGTTLILGSQRIYTSSVEVMLPPVFKDGVTTIKILSPVTIRSTWQKKDGTKKTYYYSPLEKDFSPLIEKNILKKYYSFTGWHPENPELEISPLYFSEKRNSHVVVYKDFVIEGYSGIYRLKGSAELKQFAYDVGLGERNSQGFGMFDKWKKQE
ncbi:MAG: CRISPR-associated endoribonuclease Cas6 [Candidatus Aminicenantes bacterium]